MFRAVFVTEWTATRQLLEIVYVTDARKVVDAYLKDTLRKVLIDEKAVKIYNLAPLSRTTRITPGQP